MTVFPDRRYPYILLPAAKRHLPDSCLREDQWLFFLPLLLFLGLAVRAVWGRFNRPALLRLGLAVGLFATATILLHLLRIPALISIDVSPGFYYPKPYQSEELVLLAALFPLPWGGYRRRPFVVLAAWLLSFGLDRLVFFLSPDHMFPVFLFYYWPLFLLLFYLAAAWAGAVWERRAARRS